MQKPMWDKIKRLVLYLRKKGLRVDGIGWQAHVNVGWEKKDDNMNRLSQLMQTLGKRKKNWKVVYLTDSTELSLLIMLYRSY